MDHVLKCPACEKPVMSGKKFMSGFILIERVIVNCDNCRRELKMDGKFVALFLFVALLVFMVAGYPVERAVDVLYEKFGDLDVLVRLARAFLLLLVTGLAFYVTAWLLDRRGMRLYALKNGNDGTAKKQ
jgi:hypothetical protein